MKWIKYLQSLVTDYTVAGKASSRMRHLDRWSTGLKISDAVLTQMVNELPLREFMSETAMQLAILTKAVEESGIELRQKYSTEEWLDKVENFHKETVDHVKLVRKLMEEFQEQESALAKALKEADV